MMSRAFLPFLVRFRFLKFFIQKITYKTPLPQIVKHPVIDYFFRDARIQKSSKCFSIEVYNSRGVPGEFFQNLARVGGVYVEIQEMQLSLHAHYTRHTFFTTHPPLCEPLFDQAKRNFGAIFFDLTTRSGASLHAAHYMSLSRYTFALTTRVTTRTAKMGASGNFIFHPSLHTRSLTARSLHERAAADTRLTTRWSHCTSHYTLPTRPNSL